MCACRSVYRASRTLPQAIKLKKKMCDACQKDADCSEKEAMAKGEDWLCVAFDCFLIVYGVLHLTVAYP